jgi:hypothetical protein
LELSSGENDTDEGESLAMVRSYRVMGKQSWRISSRGTTCDSIKI